MQYGAESLQLPTTRGWDWRFRDGGGYLTILVVDSEEEKKSRTLGFRQAIRPFLEDYDGLWSAFKDEMVGRYEKIRALDGETATNIRLLDNFEQGVETCRRMWEIHMYMLYGTYMPYVLFEQLCKHLLDMDDTHPDFHRLMSGFDNESFRVDKGLWECAQRLRDMGLADECAGLSPALWEATLTQSGKGREFLKDFMAFLDAKAGWRMERMAEINVPTWSEKPSQAFQMVSIYLKMGREFDLDMKRQRLEQDRITAEREVLEKIAPQQRDWMAMLLKIAQNSSRFSEEHNHYLDLYCHAVLRKVCLDMGRRFAKNGTIEAEEDVFFLIPDEVRKAGINPSKINLKETVARRKAAWREWNGAGNPPVILRPGFGMVEAWIHDPLARSPSPSVVVGKLPMRAGHEATSSTLRLARLAKHRAWFSASRN
jgi:hypothetical protein